MKRRDVAIWWQAARDRWFGRVARKRWWQRGREPAPAPPPPMPPPGPRLEVPPGGRAAKGRPSLVIQHGTWRCPSALTESVEVEDREVWRSPAYWRRLLPDLGITIWRYPTGTFTAADIRKGHVIARLEPGDQPPAEAPPVPTTVRVEIFPGVVADAVLSTDGTRYVLTQAQQERLRGYLRRAS